MIDTVVSAPTEVRTLDEIRALPHLSVLLHPVGEVAQVREVAEDWGRGVEVVARCWLVWSTDHALVEDESLVRWLENAGPGAAYRVLHVGSRPWEGAGE